MHTWPASNSVYFVKAEIHCHYREGKKGLYRSQGERELPMRKKENCHGKKCQIHEKMILWPNLSSCPPA